MYKKKLNDIIKLEKSKIQFYILIIALLPFVILTIFLSFIYLNSLDKIHINELYQLRENILEEKKIYLRDAIDRTIFEIDKIKETVKKENPSLSQEEIDTISMQKTKNYIRGLRLSKKRYYIWINKILNYDGGDNYAIRLVHPNMFNTENSYLSTNTKDIKGNLPYKVELEGIKKDGELYYEYYFKKLDSQDIAHKLSFAKLYKPFDWVIGTGLYLDDLNKLVESKKTQLQKEFDKQKNISIIVSIIIIVILIFVVFYFNIRIKKLIKSYENQIDDYTKMLNEMATTDTLTGLYNRLELDYIYNNELEKVHRYNNDFSIIMIDIDYFKSVNDTYGHQVGDSVLKELSEILKNSVRSVDSVGRWGGEEFLIICSQTNLEGAIKLAEHIRINVESHYFNVVGKVTSSFGVTTFQEKDTQESMTSRADSALYQAKKSGRNNVKSKI